MPAINKRRTAAGGSLGFADDVEEGFLQFVDLVFAFLESTADRSACDHVWEPIWWPASSIRRRIDSGHGVEKSLMPRDQFSPLMKKVALAPY